MLKNHKLIRLIILNLFSTSFFYQPMIWTRGATKKSDSIVEISSKEQIKAQLPAVLEFYSNSCGTCKMFQKTYSQLATEFPQVNFLKVDIIKHPAISKAYGIASVPSFVILDQNIDKPIGGVISGANKNEIIKTLKKLTKKELKREIKELASLAELEKLINETELPFVVAEYHAEAWCPACKHFAQPFAEIADEYGDVAIFVKIDDSKGKNKEIANKHKIKALPTTLVFRKGNCNTPFTEAVVGASKDKLLDVITKLQSTKSDTAAAKSTSSTPTASATTKTETNTPSAATTTNSGSVNSIPKIIEIKGKQQLDDLIKNITVPLIVDYHAESWCGACKAYRDIFGTLAFQFPNLQFAKIDHNDATNTELANTYEIKGFPTTLFFNQGQLSNKVVGINMPELQKNLNDLNQQGQKS